MDVDIDCSHPDDDLLWKIHHACQWWRAQPRDVAQFGAPSSALTGGGAIASLERTFSRLPGDGRPALFVPSATYGLRAALDALDVGLGDEVIIPALDWTASYQAVHSLGALPVPVAVDRSTCTLSPQAAATARTGRTRAAIACHLHGVAADVPQLISSLNGLPVIEDCAAALGSSLDGRAVGTMTNSFAVFSFGPGKTINAGEGAILVAADERLHLAAVARTAHPLRQLLFGLDPANSRDGLSIRPSVVAAIVALHQLSCWDGPAAAAEFRRAAEAACRMGHDVIGLDGHRENAQRLLPLHRHGQADVARNARSTTAEVLAAVDSSLHAETNALRDRIGLLPV